MTVSGAGMSLSSLTLYVEILHTFAADMDITLTSPADYAPWVAKFAPDGTPLWARVLIDAVPVGFGTSLASTRDGNVLLTDDGGVIVTGRCIDALDVGDDLVPGTPFDPFVVRLSAADGAVEWGHRFVGLGEAAYDPPGMFAAAGPGGDTWVAGTLFGALELGGQTLESAGYGDVLLIRFDPAGQPVWHAQLGNAGMQSVGALASGPDGAPVAVGRLEGSLTVEGVELASAGLGDVFVLRWTPTGALAWAQRFGENLDQAAESVAIAGDRIFIAGTFQKAIDLGGGSLHAGFDEWGWIAQPFLAAFDLTGAHQWSRRFDVGADRRTSTPWFGAASPQFLVGSGWLGPGAEIDSTHFGDPDGAYLAVLDSAGGGPRWLRGVTNVVTWKGLQLGATMRDGRLIAAFVDSDLHDLGGGPLGQTGALSLYLAAYRP